MNRSKQEKESLGGKYDEIRNRYKNAAAGIESRVQTSSSFPDRQIDTRFDREDRDNLRNRDARDARQNSRISSIGNMSLDGQEKDRDWRANGRDPSALTPSKEDDRDPGGFKYSPMSTEKSRTMEIRQRLNLEKRLREEKINKYNELLDKYKKK